MTQQLERRDPTQEDEDEDEDEEMDDEGAEDSDSESEDDEDEDEDDGEPDLELRSKIEEALRAGGIEPADDSEGEDDSEEEEGEVMDDDQMMAIDDKLAEIFRSRVSNKKGGKGVDPPLFPNMFVFIHDFFRCKCPTRGNPLQESGSRSCGHLHQETAIQCLYTAPGSTSAPACHHCQPGREPIV